MPSKIIYLLLGTTLISTAAMAGLKEAIFAYDASQYQKAQEEFSYLADEGDGTALYYMGQIYEKGLGTPADKDKAMEYYKRADAAGNSAATATLASLIMDDTTIQDNNKIGLDLLKKSAYNGNADALFELGELYSKGEKIEREYTYAFGYYLMAALKGDKRAQHRLAFSYLNGRGTPQDFESGVKWLQRSANQGYVLAQKDLADLQSSDPRLANPADAYAWYSIIAAYNTDEIGNEAAKRREDIAKGLRKNDVLIARQRAAREWRPITPEMSVPRQDLMTIPTPIIPGFNDNETIQKRLEAGSIMMTDGSKYGITPTMIAEAEKTKDIEPMAKIIEESVKNGNPGAFAYFGDLMQSRFKDDKAAFKWYQKGATLGDDYARYQLANLYCEGRGVNAPNVVECYKWLLIADKTAGPSLQGPISQAIKTVETNATQAELKAGQKAMDEYNTNPAKKGLDKKTGKGGGFNFF